MFDCRRAVFSSLLSGALAILLNTVALAASEVTVRPSPLGLPLTAGETVTQSLFLSAAQPGPLTVNSITIEYITGRDDARLNTGAAQIVEFTPGASGTTISFGVTLTRKEFSYPGTYKLGLRIRGQRSPAPPAQLTPVDELVEVPVIRAAAQITVKIGTDAKVTVGRGGERQINFAILQDGGADIGDLKLVQGTVARVGDTSLAPGIVELVPPTLTTAGGMTAGTLRFKGFSDAGDYKSDLSFISANLAKPVTVPVTIRVKDSWLCAFLTIMLGVIGGTLVYALVHMWRPRQLLAYRLAQLQGRLQALQSAIHEAATEQEYRRLEGRLYRLTQGIDLDLTNDAAVLQVQTEVETFESKIAKVQAEVDQALKTLTEHLRQARNDLLAFGGTAQRDLDRIQELVDKGKTRYEEGHAEEAAALVRDAEEKLKDTRLRLAEDAIASMQQTINGFADPKKSELNAKAQQAAADIKQPNARIGEILAELYDEINAAKPRTAMRRLAAAPTAGHPFIRVSPAPEDCRAGISIDFDLGDHLGNISEVIWSFDGIEKRSPKLPLKYRFTVPGQYLVRADVKYADGTSDTAAASRISILPSATQGVAQKIRRTILEVDLALLVVALILATITGLLDRYVDKPFGTVSDYCWAFLWGFGIDNVVRGFGATLDRIKK